MIQRIPSAVGVRVGVQALHGHFPGSFTRYVCPVSLGGVLGVTGGVLFLRFCAGIGSPYCWRALLGPLVHGCSETVRTWDDPMRGLLPLSLPSPTPYNPDRCSGAPRSWVCGDLCRFRRGHMCCRIWLLIRVPDWCMCIARHWCLWLPHMGEQHCIIRGVLPPPPVLSWDPPPPPHTHHSAPGSDLSLLPNAAALLPYPG